MYLQEVCINPAKYDKSIIPHIGAIKAQCRPACRMKPWAERTIGLLFATWSTALADGENGELHSGAALQTRACSWIQFEKSDCHLLKRLQVCSAAVIHSPKRETGCRPCRSSLTNNRLCIHTCGEQHRVWPCTCQRSPPRCHADLR